MIEMNDERESGKSILAEWHNHDEDELYQIFVLQLTFGENVYILKSFSNLYKIYSFAFMQIDFEMYI